MYYVTFAQCEYNLFTYLLTYYINGVAWVLPITKYYGNCFNNIQISLLFMNNFNSERKAGRPSCLVINATHTHDIQNINLYTLRCND